jgi:hypothetical protein
VTTIQRLQSVQLFTESKDQDFCDDEALGTWTWFELAIMENADAKVPRVKDGIQLSWTSHKNVLNCGTYTWVRCQAPLGFPHGHSADAKHSLKEPCSLLTTTSSGSLR